VIKLSLRWDGHVTCMRKTKKYIQSSLEEEEEEEEKRKII
jgi:hypothetical protein